MSTLHEAAVRYASRGWAVFPCRAGGKQPATRAGLHDATTDANRVAEWWSRTPNANIGVRTGAASGVVVLDIDGDDGYEALRRLEREHGTLPLTSSVVTPRGGAHLYFRHPSSTVPCSASRLAPGLDVRGDGGYVIAPPSIGSRGRRYEPDERAPIANPPSWLLALLQPADGVHRRPEPASTWVRMARDGIPEGERNASLARLTGHLLAHDVDAHLVAELAHLVNTRARPPLPPAEVDRIVASIAGREIRRRTGAAA